MPTKPKAPTPPSTNGKKPSDGVPLIAYPVAIHDRAIAPLTDEQRVVDFGVSGLRRIGNYLYEEFLPELQGQRGAKLLREMRENDPTVGAMLFLLEAMVKQVPWTVVGHDGKADDKNADAEYIRQCLFEDMSKTWPDTLSEICSMFWAGYAPMEMVYKKRGGPTPDPITLESGAEIAASPSQFTDGKWGWDKWAVRAQETILRWQFDARNDWQAFEQQAAPDFIVRTVPREKCLLFRVKSDRDNPEGRSLIRSAYTSWQKKKKLETIEGIGIERKLAGFPVLQPPENSDLWNPNDPNAVKGLAAAKDLVKNVRMDEQMGMVLPFGWEFKLISGDGGRQATDTNMVIERYDHRMAMTIAMDFIFLGSGNNGGARAQSIVDVQLFNTALTGILDGIAEIINRHAIPKLFALNGGVTDKLPKLVHGDAGSPNLTALASYITSLAQAGMALFPDADLEHSLREYAGLPEAVGGTAKPLAATQETPQPLPETQAGEKAKPGEKPKPGEKAADKATGEKPPIKKFYQHLGVVPPDSDRAEFIRAVKILREGVAKLVGEGR
jgi:hypothetical protein